MKATNQQKKMLKEWFESENDKTPQMERTFFIRVTPILNELSMLLLILGIILLAYFVSLNISGLT